jgi:hypothetical protein
MNFEICEENLYKKGVDGLLLICLDDSETFTTLVEVHDGICGAHQAGDKMNWILNKYNYYWPSMIKDCHEYAKSCQDFHKYGQTQQVPASALHSIIKPSPFRGWTLGLICQNNPASSKQLRFILVGVDYTKWVEVIPLRKVDQQDINEFIEKHIVQRYGILETITTDQGSMFVGQKVTDAYLGSRYRCCVVQGSDGAPRCSAVEQVVPAGTPTLKSLIELGAESVRVR